MRPLLLNTTDQEGGAAIATYRLHSALRRSGVDSTLLVQRKSSSDASVLGPATLVERAIAWPRRSIDKMPVRMYPRREPQLFSPAIVPDRVGTTVRRLDPDLVHLFWITGGFVRPESLAQFKRPIVWTLHDMWPLTGGCHYDAECGRYRSSCGSCPRLGSGQELDLSRRLWSRKRRAWQGLDLTIVATSHWLAACARASSLFSDRRIEVIPNCADLDVYRPMTKHTARAALGLEPEKRLILLSAFSATSDPRKGYQYLAPAIRELAERGWGEKAELVVLGAGAPAKPEGLGMEATYVPYLGDEQSQVLLYSACDVLVAPSVQENLSNTVLESMACGTPVVAFNIGGMPDMIAHLENGYLAEPYLSADLANGIEFALNDAGHGAEMGHRARAHALSAYPFDRVAGQYQSLYRELIK